MKANLTFVFTCLNLLRLLYDEATELTFDYYLTCLPLMYTGNDHYSGNDRYSGLQGPDRFFRYIRRSLYLNAFLLIMDYA